jgi:hypothetical protein
MKYEFGNFEVVVIGQLKIVRVLEIAEAPAQQRPWAVEFSNRSV